MKYNEIIEKFSNIYKKYSFLALTKMGDANNSDPIPILSFGEGKESVVFIVRNSYAFDVFLYFLKECGALYKTDGKFFGVPIKYIYKKITVNIVVLCDCKADDCKEYIKGIMSNYFSFSNGIVSVVDISDIEKENQKYPKIIYQKHSSPFISYTCIRKDLFSFLLKNCQNK